MSAHTPRAKNLALALLAMTQFVIVIDASIVNEPSHTKRAWPPV
jgi:hypothetical protein